MRTTFVTAIATLLAAAFAVSCTGRAEAQIVEAALALKLVLRYVPWDQLVSREVLRRE